MDTWYIIDRDCFFVYYMSKRSISIKEKPIKSRRTFPKPSASRFQQSSPVNLQSFESHLNRLHLEGNRMGKKKKNKSILVPFQNYSQGTASPIPSTVSQQESEKQKQEEKNMTEEDSPKFHITLAEDDGYDQYVEIDRGGKRKTRKLTNKKKNKKTRSKKKKSKKKSKSKKKYTSKNRRSNQRF